MEDGGKHDGNDIQRDALSETGEEEIMTKSIPGPGPGTIPVPREETVSDIFTEAKNEVLEEIREDAKRRIKRKMKELNAAEKVVANIKREIEELKLEISQELSGA